MGNRYKMIVAPEVRYDIREAKLWYKEKSPLLPARFAEEVRSVIRLIGERPLTHAVRYRNVRIANLKVFPYAVHYLVEEDTIVILAIFHTSIDPKKWKNR